MASVHGIIEGKLQQAGYATPHAKAIVWVAKAAPECMHAKKWWTMEPELLTEMNLEVLWETVRKIAARYALAFLMPRVALTPEVARLERELLEGQRRDTETRRKL